MQTLFSTRGAPVRTGFKLWREAFCEQFGSPEMTPLGDKPFEGTVEAALLPGLPISRVTVDALRSEGTPSSRRHDNGDTLAVLILRGGSQAGVQEGRESEQRIGDLAVFDSTRPITLQSADATSSLLMQVPRRRFEEALGPARLFTSLSLDSANGGASLATTFFDELIRVEAELAPAMAAQMASIGVDLLIAAMADRLAREVPRSIHGDVAVQRAKAHVESNLGDPRLDSEEVAAAAGVSVRRLQELFQERGRNVAGWIWERRLERASASLADPGRLHLSVGSVAYSCGFVSQAHFSTRFKRRYGLSPRDFRMRASERRAEAVWDGEYSADGPPA